MGPMPPSTDSKFTENQHSLGSSLINSVPQTTRRTEEKFATEHQKLDLKKQIVTDNKQTSDNSFERSEEQTDHKAKSQENVAPKNSEEDEVEHKDQHLTYSNNVHAKSEDAARSEPKEPSTLPAKEPSTPPVSAEVASIEHAELQQGSPHHKVQNEAFSKSPDVPTISAKVEDIKASRNLDDTADKVFSDRSLLSTDNVNGLKGYTQPRKTIEGCIFPMLEAEMKLWELKNRKREQIISKQKYRLKKPITCLQEYPFMSQNLLVHEQAIKPILLKSLRKLKDYEHVRVLQLKKQFLELDDKWNKQCKKLEDISKELRKDELDASEDPDKDEEAQKLRKKEADEQQSRATSRRRNRADFVDDTEIENVLLQIDPDYKHHQLAATIPPMIINPVEKFAVKYKDVNNLVTDKDSWALRVLRDGIDTFSQTEHDMFVEGYLTYPKRFGKISQYMGGLRKPQECVLHYYKTKKDTNYKQLLIDKNKRRKINAVRRRKEKEREKDNSRASVDESGQEFTELTETNKSSLSEKEKTVDETEDEDLDQKELTNDIEISSPKDVPEAPAEVEDFNPVKEEAQENVHPTNPNVYTVSSAVEDELNSKKRKIQQLEEVTNELPNLQPIAPAFINEDKEATDVEENKSTPKYDEIDKTQQSKKRSKHNDGYHKSSYWSVKETNMFPELLKEFGTQWALISERLGTKSTTMVRNYFQRNAEQMGWQSLVDNSSPSVENNKEPLEQKQISTAGVNDVPQQQSPSVSIFNPAARTSVTPMQAHSEPNAPVDNFSQQSTPQGLPPPRLPSINFGTHATQKEKKPILTSELPSGSLSAGPESGPSVHFAPGVTGNSTGRSSSTSSQADLGSRRSSIKSLLNNDTSDCKQGPGIHNAVDLPRISPSAGTNSSAPVIVQELQSSTFTAAAPEPMPRSSFPPRQPPFLSSILNVVPSPALHLPSLPLQNTVNVQNSNPAVAQPVFPPIAKASPATTNPVRPPEFNFANDPLAALAAVASAPEALASLIPQDGGASNSGPGSSNQR